jgi:polyhydroxyalkanoate synthase subunit PhaC
MAASAVVPGVVDLAGKIRTEVDRAILRSAKSLNYLGSPAPAVGATPKTVLHRRGTLALYHYHATADEVYRVPILFVMAPTNKAFVFDLAAGRSLVQFLLERGYDVYVMDWNPPSHDERHLKLDDYVLDFIPDCLQRVREDSSVEDVTLVGYCMGGLMSAIGTALRSTVRPRNLVCFTTPIDFKKMELWQAWYDPRHFDVDRLVDTVGIVDAQFVFRSFDLLRPASGVASHLRLWDNLWNDEYVRSYQLMQRWTAETLPLPGEYVRQVAKELMQKNALFEGTLRVGGERVEIGNIDVPMLHILAEHDHMVPPESGRPLIERARSRDKQELLLPGGHVSLIAGPNAVKRMWPALDQWLGERST